MAKIQGVTDERIFQIKAWLGLNENPDGDTKLKMGEAAVMRNFKITRDGNLQRRPGTFMVKGMMQTYRLQVDTETAAPLVNTKVPSQLPMFPDAAVEKDGTITLSGEPVIVSYDNAAQYAGHYWPYGENLRWQLVSCVYDPAADTYTWNMRRVRAVSDSVNKTVAGLWAGNVKGKAYLVGACDGKLWKLHDGADFCKEEIGSLTTTNPVHFFGYSEKLYMLNGVEYKEWDGETLRDVEGYRPLVAVSVVPAGGGEELGQVNKLNGLRRVQFSPDGEATVFTLPEKGLASVDFVKNLATQEDYGADSYTVDLTAGTVTFTAAPTKGTNTLEIGWTYPTNFRDQVLKMKFAEIFNGANDNRVFLYGDGSNKAFYTGLDDDGIPRADYFPDMNELIVGEANTPITSLIRHYSRLMAYKSDSAYSIQYGVTTLASGLVAPTYYNTPVNRTIGNAPPGQVRLVLNSPRSLFGHDLYEWKNNASYSSNLSVDERQAQRISDRITASLDEFDLKDCYCFDDNDSQEYYICWKDKALVHNYAADVWYCYDSMDVACMVSFRGELFVGDRQGRLCSFAYRHKTDHGETIHSYWESGSIAFERDFMRKYSAMLWIGIKPEERGEVWVTIQTDRKSEYTQKLVASSLMTFSHVDFRKWSFRTNRKPQMTRLKIKAKKFVFYKLVLSTESNNTTVTVLSADFRIRYTGYAR